MNDDDVPRGGAPGDSALGDSAPDDSAHDLDDDVLTVVDHAFFQLRRMWAKPHLARRLSGQEGGKRVQLSNLMVISAIAHLRGEAAGEVTVGAVAERLDVDPSTASRLVTHAIDAGFVARRASPVDARRAHLELTASGQRVKAVANRFRRRYFERLMADWDPAERTDFARLLRRFTDAAVTLPFSAASMAEIFEVAGSAADRGENPAPESPPANDPAVEGPGPGGPNR